MSNFRRVYVWICVLSVSVTTFVILNTSNAAGLLGELEEGFSVNIPAYLWIRKQDVYEDSILNPSNQIATIPETERLFEMRPDFLQSYRDITLSVKPRFRVTDKRYDTNNLEDVSDHESFINEADLQIALQDTTFLSFGREVLLWGPSMFISVSNPFYTNNGRSDPFTELGGRDIAKLIYIFGSSWTVTYLHNSGIGKDIEPASGFEPISAIKIDYLGDAYYSSFVYSKQPKQSGRVGGYFGITASSALLLYAEATAMEGSGAFYPMRTTSPAVWEMKQGLEPEKWYSATLLGFAYTFMNGLTLNFEYLHNRFGYDDAQASDYYALAEYASQQFLSGGSAQLVGEANMTNLLLLRRNYIFTQLNYPDPAGKMDWTVRYSVNLDDSSSSINASMTWSLTDNMNLFFLGVLNNGERNEEYGQYYRSLIQAGMTYFLW